MTHYTKAALVSVAFLILSCIGPKSCKSAEISLMHRIELVTCTYAFTDFGLRIIPPHKGRWMIPVWGVIGCGGYRYLEDGNKHLRARKFMWDMTGMGLRFLVGNLKSCPNDPAWDDRKMFDVAMGPQGIKASAKVRF